MKSPKDISLSIKLEEYENAWKSISYSLILFKFKPNILLSDIICNTKKNYPFYSKYIFQPMDELFFALRQKRINVKHSSLPNNLFLGVIDESYYSDPIIALYPEKFQANFTAVSINKELNLNTSSPFHPFSFIYLPSITKKLK